MEANQLEVWAEMLNPEKAYDSTTLDMFEQGKSKTAQSIGDWTTAKTDIGFHIRRMRQWPGDKSAPVEYCVFIKCVCGAIDYYSNALSGDFALYTCKGCGRHYDDGECSAAFKRGIDEKIKRLSRGGGFPKAVIMRPGQTDTQTR